ncbi:MAG: transposase [Candidatus Thermoplasmatota archaeon]|nr:transposase [Candidatus Thermoplasmatota archaeon]
MTFIRKIKKKSGTYLAEVENTRVKGKVVQRVIRYIGKEVDGEVVRRVKTNKLNVEKVTRYLDVLAVDKIAEELNLKQILGENAKYILVFVYSHLLEKLSVNKLGDWLKHTEIPRVLEADDVSTKILYQTLEEINDLKFEDVEIEIYRLLKEYENVKTGVIIDVTDTYFEGNTCDVKSRRGKDGKYKKLIQIGLAVTETYSFPIFHKQYPGNISNIKIFKDMLVEMRARRLSSIIMDRGMYSKDNIDSLLGVHTDVICGVKKTQFFKTNFLNRVDREELYTKRHRVSLKNTHVYVTSFKWNSGKLLIVYNPSLEVVRREIHYEKGGIDEKAKFLGYSLIFHTTSMDDKTVVKKYFDKDVIEKSFKQLKGILGLRPIRVWLKTHVEGHVKICYLSYVVLSLLGYKVKKLEISAPEALDKLKHGYKVRLKDSESNFEWSTTVTLEKIQEKILDGLGVVYKN